MGRRPTPLPATLLSGPFSVQVALDLGVPESRLRLPDLQRPFAGVRIAAGIDLDVLALARAYATKLPAGAFFSHATAAVLHGMWLPLHLERERLIDVSVFPPQREPRERGVRGHRLEARKRSVTRVKGLPVLMASEVWCQLVDRLGHDDLVAAADSLVRKGVRDVEHRLQRLHAAASVPGRHGRERLLAALREVRPGTRSRREVLLRLTVVHAGLPEPVVNLVILDAAKRFVAEGDLVYPGARALLEYEGEDHRLDRAIWRRDIRRRERLMDHGWWTIRITDEDLNEYQDEMLARIERTLRDRGMSW